MSVFAVSILTFICYSYSSNILMILVEIIFGAFIVATAVTGAVPELSGVAEWLLSYGGGIYLWSFVGFLKYLLCSEHWLDMLTVSRFLDDEQIEPGEHTPLLQG